MTKTCWPALGALVLSLSCSSLHAPPAHTARIPLEKVSDAKPALAKKKPRKAKPKAHAEAEAVARVAPRKVGDYFVHRFSGSFRQGPLTLIERVVAEKEGVLIVDYTLEDGANDRTLRVELDPETEQPRRVLELTDDAEVEVPLATYEAMLEQTVFSPDINEELIDESERTCLVGPKELDCEVKQFRVFVGEDEARLTVTQSDEMPGRDLAGEVTAIDGSVIYRAELLEAGNTPAVDADSVATK